MPASRERPHIEVRHRVEKVVMHRCMAPGCGELFEPARKDQAWCSPACRKAAHDARRKKVAPEVTALSD